MPTLSVEEVKAAVRRYVDELYNKGNTAVAYENLAPNLVYHTAQPPITPDREGLIQEMTSLRNAFPDLHATVDDVLVEGDKVMTRWTIRGTHEGAWLGISPTHKQVVWSGIALSLGAKGKPELTVEMWNFPDGLSLFQQLGAFPQAGIGQQADVSQAQPQA